MNSSREFNSVVDTINHYQIDPAEYFCPNSSSLSAIYDSSKCKVLKMVEINMKKILLIKNLMLPHISASKNFLGCTILILFILCASARFSVSNPGCTFVMRIAQSSSEGTENKVWIKLIWCIREKFCLQNYGVASGFLLVKFFSFFISIIFKTLDLELS